MKPTTFMVIAGEASGDLLAAELVQALREELPRAAAAPSTDTQPLYASLAPRFFGAGGPRMAAAGVELAFDMTAYSVIGLSDVLKSYLTFRRLFHQLFQLALQRQPEAIICVDFSGFNRRFAHAIKEYVRSHHDWFHPWNPKIIQYVSPQVWASREGRAAQMARDYDLLLSTFAFEKEWYAKRAPKLRVEFVGNAVVDRYRGAQSSSSARGERASHAELELCAPGAGAPRSPLVLLLPGSRPAELRRHVPLLTEAARRIAAQQPVTFQMIVPNERLAETARQLGGGAFDLQVGNLSEALGRADLALTKSGTVTLECACAGVPAIVFYITSPLTYQIGKRIVKVKYLAMPNLLADEPVFPEFIQDAATPENLARTALELLSDQNRRCLVKSKLANIIGAMGGAGASHRAARAVLALLR